MKKIKFTHYIGIVLGALYGVGFRLLCENDIHNDIFNYYDIYSITFIWLVPIVIGIIPILFAPHEIYKSSWKPFVFPFISVLLFFLFALSSGLEDWLCILLLAMPFLLAAGVVGVIFSKIVEKRNSKKLYSILLLPLILSPIESSFTNDLKTYGVRSDIVIYANKEEVWNNLIEVTLIDEDEYKKGFYHYIGVPRPLESKLETIDGQEYRIGYFTEGLKLYESISEIDTFKFVNFKIHIEKSELRETPTDKHLLNSDYFKFENISYSLSETENGQIKLHLNCEYTINSKMNLYANFWAKSIILDFEQRLLAVLKKKIENSSNKEDSQI